MTNKHIFISYSHKDQEYFDEFLTYLQGWQDQRVLDIWTDRDIEPNEDWDRKNSGSH